MESIEPKIVAAISAGIVAFRKDQSKTEVEEVTVPPPPIMPLNLWGVAGRQDLMLQRRLWQMRLYLR